MIVHICKKASDEHVDIAIGVFKLLSDPTRLRILWALLHGEHSVSELADAVNIKPAVASQHLAKLRTSHIVSVRREGVKMFYHAENEHVLNIIERVFAQAEHINNGEHK